MRFACIAILGIIVTALPALSADQPTSLSDARTAVEANLRTPEGKAYDEKLGPECVGKHLGPFRQCKQSAGDDRSFWILLKLDKEGTVKELLFYPETRLASCARDPLLKDKLPAAPHPAYWVSIYMQRSK